MRVLLLNTTRFGDTLQMQPLIHVLRNQGHELAYVCLENFIEVTTMLDGVEHAFPIPGGNVLKNLSENNGKDWYKALHTIEKYAESIYANFKPEKVINLIATPLARILALRICMQAQVENKKLPKPMQTDLPQVVGFTLHEQGYKDNTNAWASYMEAVTLNRVSSPYNLSDLFTLLAGESLLSAGGQNARIAQLSQEVLEEGKNLCLNLSIQCKGGFLDTTNPFFKKQGSHITIENRESLALTQNTKNYIAFQLGASEERRQWQVENFAKLSILLYDKGYIPILVGAPNEEKLAIKFYEHGGIAKSAIGKTSINTLGGLLTNCAMIISNDTGTMHLAAALDIPIIGIFLATAQAWDTGAVSTDACFVEPNLECHPCNFSTKCPHNFICRSSIPANIIAEVALKRLHHGKWEQAFSEHTRLWESIRDKFGFLSLKPLDILDKNPRFALYSMQRIVYKALIDSLQNAFKVENNSNISCDYNNLDKDAKSKHNYNEKGMGIKEHANTSSSRLCLESVKSLTRPNFSLILFEYVDHSEKLKLHEALSRLLELFFLLSQQAKLIRQMPKMAQTFLLTNERIITSFKNLPYLVPLAYMWSHGMEKYGDDLDEFDAFALIVQMLIEEWFKVLDQHLEKIK